jgi:hypothetical protein
MKNEKNKGEEIFAIIATIIVLFSAMLDPIISVIISLSAIIGFVIYRITKRKKK